MITPPPIISSKWHLTVVNAKRENGELVDELKPDREPHNTKAYADACIEVAQSEGVPVVDMHSALISAAGGDGDERLDPYLL